MVIINTKRCSHCKLEKEKINFYRNKSTKDKLHNQCKECMKEQNKQYSRKYRKDNPNKINALNVKRFAEKLQRIPKWITKQELEQISLFYENCPNGFHVDHIVPLKGSVVSGLHCLRNLQYLEDIANLKKSNHFEPTTRWFEYWTI